MSTSAPTPRPASVREYMKTHFRHYNAGVVVGAAQAFASHVDNGGKMMVTLAGAMSTAELGRSLAPLIRAGKVHAITCTGANLEEDVFNLVAHSLYERVPNWRDLSPQDEQALLQRGMNRVTDTCIPEEEAFRKVESVIVPRWKTASATGERKFPHEFFYEALRADEFEIDPQADKANSWLLAAAEMSIPVYVPGWEDSTMGNICVARAMQSVYKDTSFIKSGLEYMGHLIDWYEQQTASTQGNSSVGFFQIGGGIAGDFPICAVPLMRQDLELDVPLWGYYCQISDAVTSYGGYSGAGANEKITWEKIAIDTPKFVIESDATIVAPLIFEWVLGGSEKHDS